MIKIDSKAMERLETDIQAALKSYEHYKGETEAEQQQQQAILEKFILTAIKNENGIKISNDFRKSAAKATEEIAMLIDIIPTIKGHPGLVNAFKKAKMTVYMDTIRVLKKEIAFILPVKDVYKNASTHKNEAARHKENDKNWHQFLDALKAAKHVHYRSKRGNQAAHFGKEPENTQTFIV